jgi:uncharacterized protein YdeI (YjbR/CyaY-like superfamily)
MEIKDGRQAVKAENRTIWRKWLENNYTTEKSVWLIINHVNSIK